MTHDDEPQPEDLAAHHELSDVPVSRIAIYAISLTGATLIICALMYGLFWWFESRTRQSQVTQYPLAAAQQRAMPPTPRLQTYPFTDINELRKGENEILESYGWVDKNLGIVRVPIDRAMELALSRGLPSRTPGVVTQPGSTPVAPAPPAPPTAAPAGHAPPAAAGVRH